MDIAELLTQDRVIPSLRVSDKAQLLQELARRTAALLNIPQKTILDALEAREKLGSTGLGQGFALPHARIEGLDRFFGLFARLARPIAYDAVDENPVDLVFLLLIPAEPGSDHMSILAAISRRIRDQELARRLRKGENAEALHSLLAGG
ncbi:MAG TPA: PTS sugar transporter subunit IIA [Methylovirgula sp.]|nr:PTS sugar transporter subunit IIA [Methylovirgula sp.]